MADTNLSADLNILQNAPIEIELIDDDLNIIQKLDDEPNDVGGLTSAELKEHFDRAGNIIKDYINNELIPAVVASDATEQAREAAESEREAAEAERASAETARVSAETARASAESDRETHEGAREQAEAVRQQRESTRIAAERARGDAETMRNSKEAARVSAETERVTAEANRVSAETSRASSESTRVSNEQTRTTAEATRISAESARVTAEASRNTAEQERAVAEDEREEFIGEFRESVSGVNGIVKADGSGNLSAAVEGTDYMGAVNPVGTGSFSMNRRRGTEIGYYSHAEGFNTEASGAYSHAEGNVTVASGNYSHAEGRNTEASGSNSHAEGSHTEASGNHSHAEGLDTIAHGDYSHAQGKYNVDDTAQQYADIVGWGDSNSSRKNISSLATNGDLHLAGDVYVHANDDGTGGTKLGTGGGGENGVFVVEYQETPFADIAAAIADKKLCVMYYNNRLYTAIYEFNAGAYMHQISFYSNSTGGAESAILVVAGNSGSSVTWSAPQDASLVLKSAISTEISADSTDSQVASAKAVYDHHDSTKQDKLTAGENITIVDNVISAAGGGGGDEWEFVEEYTVAEDVVEVDEKRRYIGLGFNDFRYSIIWQGTSANANEVSCNLEVWVDSTMCRGALNWACTTAGKFQSTVFFARRPFEGKFVYADVYNGSQHLYLNTSNMSVVPMLSGFKLWTDTSHRIGAGTKIFVYGRRVAE